MKNSFLWHLNRKHLSIRNRSRTSTDIHLHTILSGPHFNNVPVWYHVSTAKSPNVSGEQSLHQLQQSPDSPMTLFSKCVSAGTATYRIATACLEHELKNALASSDVRLYESLKSSGAGTTVLNWLNSSSHGGNLSFLVHARLRKALIPFIIAEEKEHLIWEWMQELKDYSIIQSRSIHIRRKVRTMQYGILASRFECELEFEKSLGSTIRVFSQMMPKISLLAENSVIDEIIHWFIRRIVHRKVIQTHWIDVLKGIILKWDTDPHYRCAQVNLYRWENELQYLQGPDVAYSLKLLQQYPTKNIFADRRRRRLDLIHLGFRVAELLLRDGSGSAMRSVTWVLRFLQAYFAAQIDSHRTATPNSRELSNLRLLDTLMAE